MTDSEIIDNTLLKALPQEIQDKHQLYICGWTSEEIHTLAQKLNIIANTLDAQGKKQLD